MNDYKRIRVRDNKANTIVKALKAHGFDAEYLGPGTANPIQTKIVDKQNDIKRFFNHASTKYPHEWGSILTNATGNQTSKIIKNLYPGTSKTSCGNLKDQ